MMTLVNQLYWFQILVNLSRQAFLPFNNFKFTIAVTLEKYSIIHICTIHASVPYHSVTSWDTILVKIFFIKPNSYISIQYACYQRIPYVYISHFLSFGFFYVDGYLGNLTSTSLNCSQFYHSHIANRFFE